MAKEKKSIFKKWWFWLIVIIIIIGAIGSGGKSDKSTSSKSDSNVSKNEVNTSNNKKEEPKNEKTEGRDNSTAKETTLSTGTFDVGSDIPEGRYVCKSLDGSGNFVVNKGGVPVVNDILDPTGKDGVKTVTCDLTKGESIQISSINKVRFTPAQTKVSDKLTTGTWKVGIDIKPGKYVATAKSGSGNFVVYNNGVPTVNEILDASGENGVKTVTCKLKDGETIDIASLNEVYFESK
ncbi:hypothetical protein K5V21_13690 [Clostridium sardiniense]|uniref:Uncharacterized protein n=1 Tax=Clostridium sardiniense TaxID=29369 RepID=A0ABS7L0W5_CLOSR|nr:hypothetical protein [Clostridium sardiniense]MBY0756498.1 hypothetical protein [Clostridium sardiniense]MDQ0460244.1 flagellar hook assembly protein FlgD [Clostridium sardiniense]